MLIFLVVDFRMWNLIHANFAAKLISSLLILEMLGLRSVIFQQIVTLEIYASYLQYLQK